MKRRATRPIRRIWLPYMTVLTLFPAMLLIRYAPPALSRALGERAPASEAGGPAPISPYDEIIKKYAALHQLDWRLVASMIYAESSFRHDAVSPAGARGLMQLMPKVIREHGLDPPDHPEENIRGGVLHLTTKLRKIRGETPPDVLRLSLAAYNAGLAHLRDAQILAARLGKNPRRWSDVRQALLLLEDPEHYVEARYGYCRGSETVEYVERVLDRYAHYREQYPESVAAAAELGPKTESDV